MPLDRPNSLVFGRVPVLAGLLSLHASTVFAAQPAEVPEIQRPSVPEPAPTEESVEAEPVEAKPAPIEPASTNEVAPTEPVSPTTSEPGTPPPPEAAPSCPCDELDWMCRQNNDAACGDGTTASAPPAEPVGATRTTEPAPRPAPHAPETKPTVELDPRGLVLELGAGIGGCRQDICVENPISFLGQVGLGYRLPRVAFVGRASFGGGPVTDDEGGVVLVQADANVEWFPASTERVDPYVGAGLGYMLVVDAFIDYMSGQRNNARYSRGALHVSAGLPFRMRKGWSIGPRFDYSWGFLGRYCLSGCESVAGLVDQDGSDRVSRSEARQTLPRPWSLMLEFRRQF